MANGTIINSKAKWSGMIKLNVVRAEGQFEVFNSAGGWAFLFSKPMLTTFNAIHDYTTDSITVSDAVRSTVLQNTVLAPSRLHQVGENSSLTTDIKQQEAAMGGTVQSPPRVTKPSETPPMGQWKPPILNFKRQDQKRLKQRWKRVESASTSLIDPQENSSIEPKSVNVLTTADAPDAEDQLLGDLPDQTALSMNPSIHTRQTNPFNPARVTEILHQVTFGDDLSDEECSELENFVKENADTFALSLSEVIPIPGAQVNLNVPEAAKFNLRIHQRPLTPEQSRFYNE
jgi:hypothetical protein